MALWSDGVGVAWNAWGNHWPVYLSTTAALALTTPVAATINWKNITNPTALASLVVTPDADINLRWRVEPSPLSSLATSRGATINWKNYTITTPVAAIVPAAATINWKNYTITAAGAALATTRDAVPVAAYWMTTAVRLDLITVINAFIKIGPWPDTVAPALVAVSAEDRVISIKAEDRSIQVEAEDRTITIRM